MLRGIILDERDPSEQFYIWSLPGLLHHHVNADYSRLLEARP
jgi:hypothetical protein